MPRDFAFPTPAVSLPGEIPARDPGDTPALSPDPVLPDPSPDEGSATGVLGAGGSAARAASGTTAEADARFAVAPQDSPADGETQDGETQDTGGSMAAQMVADALAGAEDTASNRPRTDPVPAGDAEGADGAPGPAGSIATLGNYLSSGYWTDTGRTSRWFDMSAGANNGVLYYNLSGFSGMDGYTDTNGITAARQALARQAFDFYEEVLGINFIETSSTGDHVDFFFADNDSGAYNDTSVNSGTGGAINFNVINVASSWQSGTSNANDYTLQTFIHEIGHGLGLGHQGNYNAGVGTPTYNNSAIWANDSWQQSIMSYWDQTDNTSITASFAYLISGMAADFYALNTLYGGQGYGPNGNAFNGNTIYGVGTNITATPYANLSIWADENAFCIVDADGIDTLDFSNFSAAQRIDLTVASSASTTGTISDVGGLIGNMTLAVGTVIENARGGSGSDTITGNTADNVLRGNGGNDTLLGAGGTDTLWGGDGDDILNGGLFLDTLYGENGDDTFLLTGSDIADNIYGGSGTDTFDASGYANTSLGINVNLDTNSYDFTTAGYGPFTISSVEIVKGTNHADTLTGTYGTQTLYGGGGDDTFVSLDGRYYDNTYGGAGTDTLDHSASTYAGDTFNFLTGVTIGTHFNGSAVLSSIEIYQDGSGGNTIISSGDGTYYGNGGDDVMLSGLTSVAEAMYGGAGIDTIDHRAWNGTYVFDMTTGLTNFSGEIYQGFEIVYMGNGTNSVTGNSADNTIYGGSGADTLDGGAGNDTLWGGEGDDILDGGSGIDTLYGEGGNDTFRIDFGWSGNETYYGGSGSDTIDTTLLGNVVNFTINLSTGALTYTPGGSGPITLVSFENIKTGGGNDRLFGTAGVNTLDAGDGDDRLRGGAGADVLIGGAGTDTAVYSGSNTGVTVKLWNGTGTGGHAQGDTLSGIENLIGSSFNDSLIGSNGVGNRLEGRIGNDYLSGLSGDDMLEGGKGADILDGGADIDTANYVRSGSGVTVRLWNGTGQGGDAQGDTLANIENVIGSNYSDSLLGANGVANTLRGNGGNDYLAGLSGDDQLFGGDGNDTLEGGVGADVLNGGAGSDTATYIKSTAGVTVQLWSGIGLGGEAAGDTLTSIENLTGSDWSDTLTGSGVANRLVGGNGSDTLIGLAGNDTLDGGAGNDTLDGGEGNDTLDGGAGVDVFVFQSGYGQDEVLNFQNGSDLVDLVGLSFADLTLSSVAGGVRAAITATPATWIELMGVVIGDITAADFI